MPTCRLHALPPSRNLLSPGNLPCALPQGTRQGIAVSVSLARRAAPVATPAGRLLPSGAARGGGHRRDVGLRRRSALTNHERAAVRRSTPGPPTRWRESQHAAVRRHRPALPHCPAPWGICPRRWLRCTVSARPPGRWTGITPSPTDAGYSVRRSPAPINRDAGYSATRNAGRPVGCTGAQGPCTATGISAMGTTWESPGCRMTLRSSMRRRMAPSCAETARICIASWVMCSASVWPR